MTGRSDFFFSSSVSHTQEASGESAVKHEADLPLVGASIVNVLVRRLRQRITSYSSSFLGSLFNHHAHHTVLSTDSAERQGGICHHVERRHHSGRWPIYCTLREVLQGRDSRVEQFDQPSNPERAIN